MTQQEFLQGGSMKVVSQSDFLGGGGFKIVQPDGEWPKEQVFFGKAIGAVKETGTKLKSKFFERVKNVEEIVDTTEQDPNLQGKLKPEGKLNFYEGALQTAGQAAGFVWDIVGEGLSLGYKGIKEITPESIKDRIKIGWNEEKQEMLQDPIVIKGLAKLGDGLEQFGSWAEKNPEKAKDVEALINLGTLIGLPKIAKPTIEEAKTGLTFFGKKTGETIKGFVEKGEKTIAEKSQKKVQERALEAIVPRAKDLTKPEYEEMALRRGLNPKTITKEAQIPPSNKETIWATKYKSLLQDKDPVKNLNNVSDEISAVDKSVGQYVKSSNLSYDSVELRKRLLRSIEDITDVTIPSEKRLNTLKEALVNKIVDGVPREVNQTAIGGGDSMLDALYIVRKEFDRYAEQQLNAFGGAQTLKKEIMRAIRNETQNFISEKLKDETYKESMKIMTDLIIMSEENLVPKIGVEKGRDAIFQWIKQNPTKAKIIGWGLGGTVAGKLFFNIQAQ